MKFGRCQIRASAADDRSARIALPEGMVSLVGLACWVEIRDEPHPELALRVDVSGLLGPVLTLWQGLRVGLSLAGDIGDPRSSDFRFRLDPAAAPAEPGISLVCADLLALNKAWTAPRTEPPRPEASVAAARTLSAVGRVAAARAGLVDPWANGFGAALPALLVGLPDGDDRAAFECSQVAHDFAHCLPLTVPERLADERVWIAAQPHLCRLLVRFRDWQSAPVDFARDRAAWARATGLADRSALPSPVSP